MTLAARADAEVARLEELEASIPGPTRTRTSTGTQPWSTACA